MVPDWGSDSQHMHLGTTPVRSELVWLLVTLDKDYTKANPEIPWPQWYAERMAQHFAQASD